MIRTTLIVTLFASLAAPVGAQSLEARLDSLDAGLVQQRERDAAAERERIQQQRERIEQQRERMVERQRERVEKRTQGPQETERTTRTLRIGSNGELSLANVEGDIVITRGGGSEARIEIVKTAYARTAEEAREQLKLVEVEVVERANRAEIRTRYPQGEELRRGNRRNINVSVALTAIVPPGTRVRATSVAGSISAKDITGELALETVAGTVRIANGGRVTAAKSIAGTVEVTDTNIDGALSASSASGDIVLRRVKARQLDLGSISGTVVLDDVDCQQVKGQTVSGEVRFAGPLGKNARYELTSHSGTVQVALAGGTGFEVEATSFSGSVRSDFTFDSSSSAPGFGRRRPGSVRGVVGDGSAVLKLTTFSGNIVISKR
jgi:DUF4097 and DUF4098 domain-containing protein YvlB